jgi:diacylglycerol O-acyltransferase
MTNPRDVDTPASDLEPEAARWGGANEMTDFDALMWRTDRHPQLSNCVTLIELLDVTPEWSRFRDAHQWATSLIPRLSERVVDPPVPITTPLWAADPDFDLDYHVRRVSLPAPASDAELIELTQGLALAPFDRKRPLWESILVEGLERDRAAVVLKIHHAMTDGMGFMQLMTLLHSHTRAPSNRPKIVRPEADQLDVLSSAATQLAREVSRVPGAAISEMARTVKRVVRPASTAANAVEMAHSMIRSAKPPATPPPLFRDRTAKSWRFGVLECELQQLKAASKSAGGSVNDGFLAALLGGMARYHALHGIALEELPVMFPVSRRRDDDPMGGNRMVAAFFAGPVAITDPADRITAIHAAIDSAKGESALAALEIVAPILSRLPSELGTQTLLKLCGRADLSASNVPGLRDPVYVAGARVDRVFAFGPLTGAAVLVTMNSHVGTCCIGVNCDGSVIKDRDLLMQSLGEGLAEVLALDPLHPPH